MWQVQKVHTNDLNEVLSVLPTLIHITLEAGGFDPCAFFKLQPKGKAAVDVPKQAPSLEHLELINVQSKFHLEYADLLY